MLHFAGRVPLCVNVRNLFQFESAFECDRKVNAPAQIEEILRPEKILYQIVIYVGSALEFGPVCLGYALIPPPVCRKRPHSVFSVPVLNTCPG